MHAYLQGLMLGFGLILAIGAQNAFVLRQGLRSEHVFLVCLTCAASDALLIAAGMAGFGTMVTHLPWLEPAFSFGGAAFLMLYGLLALRSALTGGQALQAAAQGAGSRRAALATCLAFTWLNPHVYLDTLVLLGSVSARFEGARLAFGGGAVSASFLFFFSLGYGARALQPLFARPAAWRMLDLLVGVTMLALAWLLIWQR